MKKNTPLVYTVLVSLFLILICYSYFYPKYWHSKVYLNHLPKDFRYTEFELKTGEISSENTIYKKATDYVPKYGVLMYKFYDFCKDWGAIIFTVLIIAFIPMLIYCVPKQRIKYGLLNSVQLVGALILLQQVII